MIKHIIIIIYLLYIYIYILVDLTNVVFSYKLFQENILLEKNNQYNTGA
jgi:hypothetical protein